LKKALLFARDLLIPVLKEGNTAVDATCGNGHDTLFLASRVGATGRVLAFDIQEQAIANTRERLAQAKLLSRVTLVRADHSSLARYVDGPVHAVMFNLGYLPGGDHSLMTRPETTVAALEVSLSLLCSGGIVTVVVYSGHSGGKTEYTAVREYLSLLPQREFTVLEYRFINQAGDPPLLLAVSRR
jgi:tRNA1(Val) A37 N6-methylase TrmN6